MRVKRRLEQLTDLHMLVLGWINFHPDHGLDDIARGLCADVAEVERLCADLEAAGFIEPMTRH